MLNKRKIRIFMGIPSGSALVERLQQGIVSYAHERGGWMFTRLPEFWGTSLRWLRDWRGDGAFVFVANHKEEKLALSFDIPVINLSSHVANPILPTVSSDHFEMGRMAALHLLSKKFRHLAFYGTADLHYSDLRLAGFQEVAHGRASFNKLVVPLPTSARFRWNTQEIALERWLRRLAKPVGIFAGTDLRASMVLEACERIGLSVPKDVAVIGVDNDPLVCELSHPPLSSISRNDFEVGRRAAAMLEDLIAGKERTGWLLVQPEGVIQRESTNTLAVEDPLIAEAIERIQKQIHKPFGAEEIASGLPISRRHFETRFRAAIGCSPYVFISELRIERAKSLLDQPEKRSLKDVAAACGFANPRRFSLVFQRYTGLPPTEWKAARRVKSY